MSAQRGGRNVQEGGGAVLGSLENSAANAAKLEYHTDQFKRIRPSDAAAEFQAKIDAILAPIYELESPDSRALNKAFNTAQGQLVNLGKQSDPRDQALRTAALDFARKGLESFPIARKLQTTSTTIDLNNTIGEKSRLPTSDFLKYLNQELAPSSTSNWRAVNVVTALYDLSKYHAYGPKIPLQAWSRDSSLRS